MECPTCGAEMTRGEISLENSAADLMLVGGGFSELLFHERGQQAIAVLVQPGTHPAMSCSECGHFLIITNPEFTDTQCVVCNSAMPAGVSTCANCGWTYDTHSTS